MPAAFNNVVGAKPTRDLLNLRGSVGTRRSLDCLSVFALTAENASLAVPAGFRPNGLPTGVTLVGPAFADAPLAELAGRLQRHLALPLGATEASLPSINE